MFKNLKGRPALSMSARAGAAAVAAFAAVSVLAGPSAAITVPGGAAADDVPTPDCVASAPVGGWTTTRCASTNSETVTKTWSMDGTATVHNIDATCGVADGYRLQNVDLSPGRVIPPGVQILEPGSIGATGYTHHHLDGYADGIQALSMSNWASTRQSVTVNLVCTKDSSAWYE